MTTLATRVREMCDLEGFDVIVVDKTTSAPADTAKNKYPRYGAEFERQLKGTKTINEWKTERFAKVFGAHGLDCKVLNGDGTVAAPQTALSTVRETYTADK